jgi:uncharacterized protein YyaL (SSP411 family)
MQPRHTNALIHETSPYLLQHAHNPVHWYPWGEEALQKAVAEDKPILVSIGYAACHWCHVMERESFENEETAALMNQYFINIKIDREERPDLDHIYMDAVQAMTGSGGWPLNVFLTPGRKPFYGGTYFPPKRAYNRASWTEILTGIHQAFREKRTEIDAQAEQLTAHLVSSNAFGQTAVQEDQVLFHPESLSTMTDALLAQADTEWGGFGKAPKFPQTFSIQFLLRQYHFAGNQKALHQALLSLDKMIAGGIYDQLGGGFARYSTDNEWLAPHFEKMLYDNALLVGVLSEAYQITGNQNYARVIRETLAFIEREMTSAEGGFFSALDADSEGVEGKFYTWSRQEVESLLGESAAIFCDYYDITDNGNWEHTNIFRIKQPADAFARQRGIAEAELEEKLAACRHVLMQHRETRIRPLLDDKILLGWNAMMTTAYAKAYAALGDESCKEAALRNARFLEAAMAGEEEWLHTYKAKQAKIPAFLDDYAMLIQAWIHLQEITGDADWLMKARKLTEWLIPAFEEPETAFFYYTQAGQTDVIVRKKEVYDGAVPSGNAVMALNLLYLSIVFDQPEWKARSTRMIHALGKTIIRYPGSFGVWAMGCQLETYGMMEIAIVGQHSASYLRPVLRAYLPNKILQVQETKPLDFPLLAGKTAQPGKTAFYLCRNYQCAAPFDTVEALLANV